MTGKNDGTTIKTECQGFAGRTPVLHYLPGNFTEEQDSCSLVRRIGEIRHNADLPNCAAGSRHRRERAPQA